jgi:hypothetical protein
MAARGAARGQLIAVDGGGAGLAAAARTLTAALRREREGSGISAWDSSGIFTEIAPGEEIPGPSARTLTLLYAADLAFRLRWQIRPALEAGFSVVAAPYVETAKALAIAAGLPRKWVQEIFRFAPKPDSCYHVVDRGGRAKSAAKGRLRQGSGAQVDYVACFVNAMASGDHAIDAAQLRKQSVAYLSALEKQGRCRRFK